MADPPSASATRPHRRSKTIERAIGSRSPFKPRSTPWTQADPSLRGRAEPAKPRYCRSPYHVSTRHRPPCSSTASSNCSMNGRPISRMQGECALHEVMAASTVQRH